MIDVANWRCNGQVTSFAFWNELAGVDVFIF